MIDRVTVLNQLADAANEMANELLTRAGSAVDGQPGITPKRNAMADALQMLDLADALADRATLEQQRIDAAGTPA